MHVSQLDDAEAFVTLDGSTIRELAGRTNTGDEPLTLLCCCAPAYSNDDTVLTGG